MKNYIINAVVALLLIVVVTLVMPKSQSNVELGGLSERDIQAVSLSVGNTSGTKGTALTFIKKGTVNCSGALAGSTVTASSTLSMDCSVTGARSGDIVFVGRPAGMTTGWFYVGAYASTTLNNYIVAKIYNNSGTNGVPPSTATTSVPYILIRS